MADVKEKILEEFNKKKPLFTNFKEKIELLLKELLMGKIEYHDISSRIKETESFSKKLNKKEKNYTKLDDITDIVGCRIITFFEDDVDFIVNIIRDQFIIDEVNSVNKKDIIESNKFGYLSYHIVCSLDTKRVQLPEYEKYKNIKVEIQIRSILQHAWAEIEHDMGYKTKKEIPAPVRRKFSRIAGLLETADENFCEIKSALKEINQTMESDKDTLYKADLNIDSLYLYSKDSAITNELEKYISSFNNSTLTEISKADYSSALNILSFFNVKTINELDLLLKENKQLIEDFVSVFLSNKGTSSFNQGVSYYYLANVLVLKEEDQDYLMKYLSFIGFANTPEIINDFVMSYAQAIKK